MSGISKIKTIFILTLLLLPFLSFAQTESFNVDPSYDLFSRQEIAAELIRTTSNLYFYVERTWWDSLSSQEQNEVRLAVFDLGEEFQNRIYPILTSNFGSIPEPGIDGDERITVLIHQMRQDAGGYFNSGDVYSRLQVPRSNQREMVYLASSRINSSAAKGALAHEFLHLITINQKDLLRRVTEEVWLNEARAEYAPTLLGYDNVYSGSNLEKRVAAFLDTPTVSLTEWSNTRADYGAVNLFAQYLVDHYGKRILTDSLQSSKVGIASLEEALQKQAVQKSFSQVFAQWAVALLVNDCRIGEKYCYLSQNLLNLRIVPTLYFIPRTATILSTVHGTKPWGANWHKFVGGESSLDLKFEGRSQASFEVPYVLCDKQNRCSVNFISLDTQQKGRLTVADFSQRYNALTIIPFVKSKTEGFNGEGTTFTFSWEISVDQNVQEDDELRNQLLARIAQLQEQLRALQAQIAELEGRAGPLLGSCQRFNNNLFFGMRNNAEVSCLQEFLKTEGVYPEGLVTGNFLSLTQAAVARFQEKYASGILAPLGLQQGTGYVGAATRAKINELLE